MKQTTQKRKQSLTKRQLQLIDALASGMEVPDAMSQCKVSAGRFRQWSKSELFQEELEFRQQLAGQQSRLLIGKFVPLAAGKLIRLLESEKEEVARKACLDILQMATANIPTTRQNTIATKEKPLSLPPELANKLLKLLAKEEKSV